MFQVLLGPPWFLEPFGLERPRRRKSRNTPEDLRSEDWRRGTFETRRLDDDLREENSPIPNGLSSKETDAAEERSLNPPTAFLD